MQRKADERQRRSEPRLALNSGSDDAELTETILTERQRTGNGLPLQRALKQRMRSFYEALARWGQED
jgi:hypothetical protein